MILPYLLPPEVDTNPWNGNFQDAAIYALSARVQDVLNTRRQHAQLRELLSSSDQQRLLGDDVFASFKQLEVFTYRGARRGMIQRTRRQKDDGADAR